MENFFIAKEEVPCHVYLKLGHDFCHQIVFKEDDEDGQEKSKDSDNLEGHCGNPKSFSCLGHPCVVVCVVAIFYPRCVLRLRVGDNKSDGDPVEEEDEESHDHPNSLSVVVSGPEVEHQHLGEDASWDVGDVHVSEEIPHDVEKEDGEADSQHDDHSGDGVAPEGVQSRRAQLEDVGENKDRKNRGSDEYLSQN